MFKYSKKITSGVRSRANTAHNKNKAVFQYYQNRDTETNPTNIHKRPKFIETIKIRLRHAPSVIAGLLIIASFMYTLSLDDSVKVRVVNADTAVKVPAIRTESEYRRVAKDYLVESIFNQNKVTVNTEALEQKLSNHFSEITNVAVVLPLLGRTPIVYVQIAEPILLLENGSSSYIVDEKGRAIIDAKDKSLAQNLNLLPVKDAARLSVRQGSQVLPIKDIQFIRMVQQQFRMKNLTLERAELPARAGEINLYVKNKPYYVKFSTYGNALQQVGTYIATDKLLLSTKQVPKEYIDVRVEERAYYK